MLHRIILLFAASGSLLLLAPAANGQFWGGCLDAAGGPVIDRPNYGLNDIANSHLDTGGNPVIEYNPSIVLSVSSQTRRFFYLHECGHHALGQVLSGQYWPMLSEQQADCWAARTMSGEGLGPNDLLAIQSDLARSPGDWSHLPGQRRALNLVACLDQAPSTRRGACRVVTDYVPQTVVVPRTVPQQIPCQHCGCLPGLGCGCQHPYDVVYQTVQVPEVQQVPVQRTVCD